MAKASVMVVEDEALVALQIKEALEARGFAVPVIAASGEEALRMITQSEPDIIVMDIRLKGALSGIDVARKIRSQLKIPVLYLTAHSDPETVRLATETEPCGYLVKPFDERSLYAAVEVCLHNSGHARSRRERDLWLKAMPDSMTDAVLLTDAKGLVKFTNSAAVSLVQKTAPELMDRRIGEVVRVLGGETREPHLFPVTEPLAEARPTPTRSCIVVTPDGKETAADLTASPLRSREGVVFGILYTFRPRV